MENVYYVGMDVHKDSIRVAILQGEGRSTVYAGCMGYTLQRGLSQAGIDCRVISPNKIDRLSINRIKTDARDLLRCREDIKTELQRTRHQISNFLLRQGHLYSGKTNWTGKHKTWMKKLEFSRAPQKEAFTQAEPYREKIARLRCFKGIDYLTALACICEVGDYRRFPSAGSFMSYLGLVPSEHSSGAKRCQGGITKTGNSHLRKLLIESSWHYRYRYAANAALKERRKGMELKAIAELGLYTLWSGRRSNE